MLEENRVPPKPNPTPTAMMLVGTGGTTGHAPQTISEFTSDGGIMLLEANDGRPMAYIPPPIAAKVGTKGQSFASYKSDGGIMMVQDVKEASIKRASDVTEGSSSSSSSSAPEQKSVLESSTDGQGTMKRMSGYWVQREIDFVL